MIYIMRRDEGEKLKIREHRDARREREGEEIKRSESTGQRASRNKPEYNCRQIKSLCPRASDPTDMISRSEYSRNLSIDRPSIDRDRSETSPCGGGVGQV